MDEPVELELLRFACQANRSGAWRFEISEDRVTWTPVLYELFGLDEGQEINFDLAMSFFASESRKRLVASVEECVRTGKSYNEVLAVRDTTGKPFWARALGFPETGADGTIVALRGAFQDISEEREATTALKDAESNLASVLELMPDGFFVVNEDWEFTFLNSASEAMLQRVPRDLIGQNLWKEFPEARGSQFEEVYRRTMDTGVSELFTEYFGPLKTWFRVATHRTLNGMAAHFRDVTEEFAQREKEQKTERLALLGQLAGGVSHDFNNLMSVILGNLEMLPLVQDEGERATLIEEAVEAIERGRTLNESLLAFAGRSSLEPTKANLSAFLDRIRPMIERTLPSRIALRFRVDDNVPSVELDEAMAESCLLNLVLNARDAIAGTGVIEISLSKVARGGKDWARVAVSDTGCGIPEDLRERIFEPFFTTKSKALGSGLGLARVKGFVEQVGGLVTMQSETDRGSVFAMHFPVETSVETGTGDRPGALKGAPIALVVDDDPAVAKVTARMFTSLGLFTLTACDPEHARVTLKERDDIAVLITDVIMPRLSGVELAREARRLNPAIEVVFISGYPEEDLMVDGVGRSVYLQKPARRWEAEAIVKDFGLSH
ncbi:ATP-binding protein [Erythrobacter sp.]|uniref:ATP-binding protein n=1 Tax=Erythrobacter sp. TaxID=1042 RepID=UPI001425ED67|nr:ATP-binding protein [Erythrobacter sp.]QIQ87805.1 MAG: response regulator [Erythrobacter sp.]